jgi:hypothetical protein
MGLCLFVIEGMCVIPSSTAPKAKANHHHEKNDAERKREAIQINSSELSDTQSERGENNEHSERPGRLERTAVTSKCELLRSGSEETVRSIDQHHPYRKDET